ncbi:MAG: hypothetical protein KJ066_11840 [Acidobacteria bacterium]|nr:hypothetical protein [Acidobacteriota bacterium]
MTATDLPRPARLWKSMSEERRLAAARAFWADEQSVAEQAEVIGLVARQIHFRPRSVIGLPAEKKARLLVRMGSVSDAVAGRLLVAYHLDSQRPMMGAFLDALGIAHEEGLIVDEKLEAPPAERLAGAAETLRGSFPADDVALYFSTLLLQDPDTWGGLREVLSKAAATT